VGLAEAAVTMQKVGAFRDPRLYALNIFAEQFSHSSQPLVPSRLFINGGGKDSENQTGGSVLETLLNLLLSEKAGINVAENGATSRPLDEFLRQFTGSGTVAGRANGGPESHKASSEGAGKRSGSG
jgi:hypothetical protein